MQHCTLSDEELIKKCQDWVTKLCNTGGSAWALRVPVDANNDPDVLFSELAIRFKQLNKEVHQAKMASKPA